MQQVSGSYNTNGKIPCVAVRLVRRLWMMCDFVQHHSDRKLRKLLTVRASALVISLRRWQSICKALCSLALRPQAERRFQQGSS